MIYYEVEFYMRCAEKREITTMWQPICDFEDEMMDMQPNHDLIFGDYSKNPVSLADPFLRSGSIPKIFREEQDCSRLSDVKNKEIHLVSKIRQPVIGRRLEEEDLEDQAEREAETLAMIRNSGYAPSVDVPLTSKKTLPTVKPSQSYKISNGCPVLLDSEFFKLKPRNPDSDSSGNNTLDLSCSSSDSNFLKHFKTLDVSQEDDDEDSSKPGSDYENNNSIKDKSSMPDIIAKMKRRRKTRMGGPVVRDKELVESNQSKGEPLSSQQDQGITSPIVCTKQFFTPKELYLKKRALNL